MRRRSPIFSLPAGAAFERLPFIAEALRLYGSRATLGDLVRLLRG